MRRWLEVLKVEQSKGFHPTLPRYGFGDPITTDVIASMCNRFLLTGAVRHGAECFNFAFPKDMDEEYLVVWEGFAKSKQTYAAIESLGLTPRVQAHHPSVSSDS